jgi:hypothetical protein
MCGRSNRWFKIGIVRLPELRNIDYQGWCPEPGLRSVPCGAWLARRTGIHSVPAQPASLMGKRTQLRFMPVPYSEFRMCTPDSHAVLTRGREDSGSGAQSLLRTPLNQRSSKGRLSLIAGNDLNMLPLGEINPLTMLGLKERAENLPTWSQKSSIICFNLWKS